jgi:anti-sigma B factor antagonist
METRVERKAGVSIITLTGDCLLDPDLTRIREAVHSCIRENSTEIIIDLRGVPHMNSCGLGALVSAYTSLCRAGGHLHITAMGRFIERLMKITHLNTILPIYPTVEEAIAHAEARTP